MASPDEGLSDWESDETSGTRGEGINNENFELRILDEPEDNDFHSVRGVVVVCVIELM